MQDNCTGASDLPESLAPKTRHHFQTVVSVMLRDNDFAIDIAVASSPSLFVSLYIVQSGFEFPAEVLKAAKAHSEQDIREAETLVFTECEECIANLDTLLAFWNKNWKSHRNLYIGWLKEFMVR